MRYSQNKRLYKPGERVRHGRTLSRDSNGGSWAATGRSVGFVLLLRRPSEMERSQLQRQRPAEGNHGLAVARGDNRVRQGPARLYEEPGASVSPPLSLSSSFCFLLFLSHRRFSCRYGNVFKTHLFGSPSIVSIDPEVNRFILTNEGNGVVLGYPKRSVDLVGKWTGGPHHKAVRGILQSLIGPIAIRGQLLPKLDSCMQSYLDGFGGQIVDIQERTREVSRFSLDPSSSKLRNEVLSL